MGPTYTERDERDWQKALAEKEAEVARLRTEFDAARVRAMQEYDERVEAETRARALGRRIQIARGLLARVYDHYTAEEIARASPMSQLGMWRDGMKALEE